MNPDILMLLYGIFKDFGVGLCEFGIIVWLLYKIVYNHLAHIAIDIKLIGKDVKELNNKLISTNEKVSSLAERTAKLEGEIQS